MRADNPLAPLVEIDGNPAPEDIRTGAVTTPDRVRLRVAVTPSRLEKTRGTVLLLQGRNETVEKYFETIRDLTGLGYMVATFDWRGQGGSQRQLRNPNKGHVSSFRAYERDLETVFREVVLPDCRGPYAILAHSMGAAVAIAASPRLVNRVERIVASAPLVALSGRRPRSGGLQAAMTALRLLGLGGLPVRSDRQRKDWDAASNPLTSDPARFERNRRLREAAPHLFVGGTTAGWVAAATGALRHFDNSDTIATYHVPTLIVTAGEDKVVSSEAAERLAWRMRSGHAMCLAGARHEILQEADRYRAPFLAAFDRFAGGALPLD